MGLHLKFLNLSKVCHKLRGITSEVQAISWNNLIYTTNDFQDFLIDKKYPTR